MKDPRLAAALLESSPDALAELFDAYGDRLFRYCWSMLRSRELAQVALRDKNQVMITAATQPLPPGAAPGAQPNGAGSGGSGSSAASGALQLSADGVILAAGSTGQITLTAASGPVTWSAQPSGSAPRGTRARHRPARRRRRARCPAPQLRARPR